MWTSPYKKARKLLSVINIRQMALPIQLGHYVHESVHGNYPAASNYITIHAKQVAV